MSKTVEERDKEFRGHIAELSVEMLMRRHLIVGDAYALADGDYLALKSEVAKHFSIHPSEVVMVGSGKMGFSIAPDKRFRPFGNHSDIDSAIISSDLFDRVWPEVFEYSNSGAYWPEASRFKDYLFRGWIRPDKLPPGRAFVLGKDWWDFFRELTQSKKYGRAKIAAGLYKNWNSLNRINLAFSPSARPR